MRIRIKESQINADPDSGEPNQCGSGSRRAKAMLIRIQESQTNPDPDPGEPNQWGSGYKTMSVAVGISVLVIKTLDPDRYSA
jgi:hypothetical protein